MKCNAIFSNIASHVTTTIEHLAHGTYSDHHNQQVDEGLIVQEKSNGEGDTEVENEVAYVGDKPIPDTIPTTDTLFDIDSSLFPNLSKVGESISKI